MEFDKFNDDFLTPKQMAKLLNVSEKFVQTHSRNLVGFIKIGRLNRFKRSEIEKAAIRGEQIVLPVRRRK